MINARLAVAPADEDGLAAVSARHSHARAVAGAAADDPARRDALHLFGILHGERPGAVEVAARLSGAGARFAAGFALERGWLVRAVAAAGPTPLRLSLSAHERLVREQRAAMLALARSDRAGAAAGLALALAADWPALRAALSGAAIPETADVLLPEDPATARAARFGAAALLGVHRAVWDLLDAREAMRLRG